MRLLGDIQSIIILINVEDVAFVMRIVFPPSRYTNGKLFIFILKFVILLKYFVMRFPFLKKDNLTFFK